MNNELAIKDIEAGVVRSIAVFPHAYYAEKFDTPESRQTFSGYSVTPELIQKIGEAKVPFFQFESQASQLRMAGMMPVVREYQNSVAPWGGLDSVPPEIGHSIMALGADKTEHFTPIKLPLALFTEKMQANLINLAKSVDKENELVQMPIRSIRFAEQPSDYFQQVVSTIMPDTLKKVSDNLSKSLAAIENELKKIEDLKDEPGQNAIFSKRHSLDGQRHLLQNHFSTLNERILIGKANEQQPQQMLKETTKAIKFENDGEKQLAQKYDKSTHPRVHARALLAEKITGFLSNLLNIMNQTYGR